MAGTLTSHISGSTMSCPSNHSVARGPRQPLSDSTVHCNAAGNSPPCSRTSAVVLLAGPHIWQGYSLQLLPRCNLLKFAAPASATIRSCGSFRMQGQKLRLCTRWMPSDSSPDRRGSA